MTSGKSARAILCYNSYIQNLPHTPDSPVALLLHPTIDTRSEDVTSRSGLSAKAAPFNPDTDLFNLCIDSDPNRTLRYVIVDEAQFCTTDQIGELWTLSITRNVNVICYGLKTDHTASLFPAAQLLLEVADEIHEIPGLCACGAKAIFNVRYRNGVPDFGGPDLIIDDGKSDVVYKSLCSRCWAAANYGQL